MAHSRRRLGFDEMRYPKLKPPEPHFVSPREAPGTRVRNGYNDLASGVRVWVSDGKPMTLTKPGRMSQSAAEKIVTDWWHGRPIYFAWHEMNKADIDYDWRQRGGVRERHYVADFNTLDDLVAHARGEGATHVLQIDDETHIYFQRRDGSYEKAEAWQKDGYWHTQAPGSRAVVRKPPLGAKPIAVIRPRMVESPRRSAHHHPGRRK